MSLRLIVSLAVAFIAPAIVSCDSDDDSDAASDLCRDVGTTICAEACACGECTVLQSSGMSTLGFESESDCRAIYVDLGCQEPDDSIDLNACSDDLKTAECADDPDGSPAFAVPASCE